MRNKYFYYLFKLILVIALPLMILLSVVQVVAFDTDYYVEKYEEYNISKETGIDIEDLTDITINLLNYLEGKKDDIVIYKDVNGIKEQIFEEKEILHLKDVKKLFINGRIIRNVSLILSIFSIIYISIYFKEKLHKVLILCAIAPFIVIILLSIIISFDFNKYFTYFHLILFDNDLWLLNPKTDILIQMYPLDFFFSIAYKIAAYFGFCILTVLTFGIFLKNKKFSSQ